MNRSLTAGSNQGDDSGQWRQEDASNPQMVDQGNQERYPTLDASLPYCLAEKIRPNRNSIDDKLQI
jgi:hypothetical protein